MHVVDTLLDFWNDVETELTPNLIERSHDTFPEIIIITVNVVKTKQSWRDFFAMRRRKTFDCCDISLLHALSAANSGGDARPKKTFTLPTLKIKCVLPDLSRMPSCSPCTACACCPNLYDVDDYDIVFVRRQHQRRRRQNKSLRPQW